MIKVAPSILSADFARLGEEIDSVRSADLIHFDVMDGTFVPNISFGLPVLESVRSYTDMPIDVHLMVERPVRFAERFCKAGADILTFHVEADAPEMISEAVDIVRACGKKVGIALKPKTPASAVLPYLDRLDMVLVMTVEPGFGGQRFMTDMLSKVTEVQKMALKRRMDLEIEVDGGVNQRTARMCITAGANILVNGSGIFESRERDKYIEELRGTIVPFFDV